MKRFLILFLLCLVAATKTTQPSTQSALKVYDTAFPHVLGASFERLYTAAGIPTDSVEPSMVNRDYLAALVGRAKQDDAVGIVMDCEQLGFHIDPITGISTYSPQNQHDRKVLNSLRLAMDFARPLCRDADLTWSFYGAYAPSTAVVNIENPAGQAEALRQRQLYLAIRAGGYVPRFVCFCGYVNAGTLNGGFDRWKRYYLNERVLAAGIGQQILVYVWPFQDGAGEYPPLVPLDWWTAEIEFVKQTGDPVALWGNADTTHPEYGVIDPNGPHVRTLLNAAK